jgi:hypothetical protein
MSGYVIQPTGDPPFVTCKSCNGRGYTTALKWGVDPDWCPECGGAKEIALDMTQLATLGRNLATAAALCRAFTLGGAVALDAAFGIYLHQWRPGCGKEAP